MQDGVTCSTIEWHVVAQIDIVWHSVAQCGIVWHIVSQTGIVYMLQVSDLSTICCSPFVWGTVGDNVVPFVATNPCGEHDSRSYANGGKRQSSQICFSFCKFLLNVTNKQVVSFGLPQLPRGRGQMAYGGEHARCLYYNQGQQHGSCCSHSCIKGLHSTPRSTPSDGDISLSTAYTKTSYNACC